MSCTLNSLISRLEHGGGAAQDAIAACATQAPPLGSAWARWTARRRLDRLARVLHRRDWTLLRQCDENPPRLRVCSEQAPRCDETIAVARGGGAEWWYEKGAGVYLALYPDLELAVDALCTLLTATRHDRSCLQRSGHAMPVALPGAVEPETS